MANITGSKNLVKLFKLLTNTTKIKDPYMKP